MTTAFRHNIRGPVYSTNKHNIAFVFVKGRLDRLSNRSRNTLSHCRRRDRRKNVKVMPLTAVMSV